MKITHLSSVHPPDDNRIFKICRSIVGPDRQVSYIVPAEKDTSVAGVAIRTVPVVSSRLKRMLLTTLRIYRRAIRERADIYQFHDPELIPVGLALRLIHKRDVIYDVHENVSQQILTKRYIPQVLRKPVAATYAFVERQAAKRLSAIVTANEDIDEQFRGSSEHIVAVHNYAEAELFGEAPAANDPRYRSGLVFHSAASERTSFAAVLGALKLIPRDVKIRLMATLNVDYESAYVNQLAEEYEADRLELMGLLPQRDMARLASQCAVSIVLYSDRLNHASIRANRFFESLAAGLPVVVPDFPEWRQTVESLGCGIAVDPNDSKAIADALHFLVTHPDTAEEMGRRGRQALLQSFSWTHEKDKLLQLYDSLLLPHRPPQQIAVTNA